MLVVTVQISLSPLGPLLCVPEGDLTGQGKALFSAPVWPPCATCALGTCPGGPRWAWEKSCTSPYPPTPGRPGLGTESCLSGTGLRARPSGRALPSRRASEKGGELRAPRRKHLSSTCPREACGHTCPPCRPARALWRFRRCFLSRCRVCSPVGM